MIVLGISDITGNHSHSCIAIVTNGHLKFALSQERQSRIKNDSQFPTTSIQAGLDYLGLTLSDIDAVACAYPPAHYYSGLLSHGWGNAFRTIGHAMAGKPHQFLRYIFPNLKKALFDPKGNAFITRGIAENNFYYIDHHLAHVTAAYAASSFDRALAVSYGGFAPHADGTNVSGAVYLCNNNSVQWIEDIPMCATGCWYSGITVALGYRYMQQESKTMGLSALGNPDRCYTNLSRLSTRFQSGRWQCSSHWLDSITSPRSDVFLNTYTGKCLSRLLQSVPPQDVAAAAQKIWQENIVAYIRNLVKRYPVEHLILTGGTFQNIIINTALAGMPEIKNTYIHPHPGDGSTPIGAALSFFQTKTGTLVRAPLSDTGLGCEFNDNTIYKVLRRYGNRINIKKIKKIEYTADRLAKKRIIGWFQGREEYGNRSLGHRCILASPDIEHQLWINTQIKHREDWIPLRVSCLAEYADRLFKQFIPSPFASFRYRFKASYHRRYKSVTHRDETVSVHSVDQSAFPDFRQLLLTFYQLTGHPLIFNTSLNIHGHPIVHTPEEAVSLLLSTNLDELIIGSFSVTVRGNNV